MFKIKNLTTTFGIFFIIFITASLVDADTEYTVKPTDNLNRIIAKFYPESPISRPQIQRGILAENPDAFKGGNINFLMRGKRLLLPDEKKLVHLSNGNAKPARDKNAEMGTKAAANTLSLQTEKVSQLKKESEDLKVRLEKLLAEKSASDAMLREINDALQKSSNQTPVEDKR